MLWAGTRVEIHEPNGTVELRYARIGFTGPSLTLELETSGTFELDTLVEGVSLPRKKYTRGSTTTLALPKDSPTTGELVLKFKSVVPGHISFRRR